MDWQGVLNGCHRDLLGFDRDVARGFKRGLYGRRVSGLPPFALRSILWV